MPIPAFQRGPDDPQGNPGSKVATMDDLLKGLSNVEQAAGAQGSGTQGLAGLGQLQQLLGGLGGATSGSLGATTGAAGPTNPLGALGTLLPAILGMLGGQSGTQQGGLNQVLGTMQANGLGGVAQSWIGNGTSQAITPAQVEQVLSSSQLSELAAKSGLPPDQLKSGLASILPNIVNHLSPNGSAPNAGEVQQVTSQLQQALASIGAAKP